MDNRALSEYLDLKGKVAIVTGAGRGIGQGIALRLAEAGAAVLATDINYDSALETAETIRNSSGNAQGAHIDVSKIDHVERAVQTAADLFGDLDILVNNAAIFPATPALEISEEQWDRVLDINLKGTFFLAQSAARKMIEKDHGGKIINISSFAWLIPPGHLSHYDASKGGIVSVTKSLAKELGKFSINVNAVAPGHMKTPGSAISSREVAAASGLSLDELPVRSVFGRYGSADDVAKAVYFLASGLSDYVTGSVLEVGGGYHLL
jgi:2-dehydro-3-deoxy-D-gluconate 5-dehydrogenase